MDYSDLRNKNWEKNQQVRYSENKTEGKYYLTPEYYLLIIFYSEGEKMISSGMLPTAML